MDLDDLSFLDGNLSTLVRRRKSFSSFVAVESIKSRLSEFPPHVTGTCPVSLEQLTVFHGVDSSNVRYGARLQRVYDFHAPHQQN